MSDDATRDDDRIDGDALEAWKVDGPPAGFADRVLAARRQEGAGDGAASEHRRAAGGLTARRWAAVVVVTACAGVVAFALLRRPAVPPVSGQLEAATRTEARLGRRGVAVAEKGAELSWRVDSDGNAQLVQSRGDVFYRVDPGGRFVVITPEGRVRVTGTCFRVEVPNMNARDALLGAAVGAALVVTVYEGKVLFADKGGGGSEARAGQRLVVSGDGGERQLSLVAAADGEGSQRAATAAEEPWARAPSDEATREELLARDEAQRAHIASMNDRIATLQRDLAAARKRARDDTGEEPGDGRPWFDPSPEQLREFAEHCAVRFDVPPVMGPEPFALPPEIAGKYGLTEAERLAINEVMGQLMQRWAATLRKLYVEATGDTRGVESLSVRAMAEEIENKSMPGEATRIRTRIAQERAGMVEPPADLGALTPLERYYRGLGSLGDDAERMLADRVGAKRARELREIKDGWGSRWAMRGCGDESDPK